MIPLHPLTGRLNHGWWKFTNTISLSPDKEAVAPHRPTGKIVVKYQDAKIKGRYAHKSA